MRIKIDTPAWSFVKYNDDGSVDYISPLPCPFNYGSIEGSKGDDGEQMDAILLGPRVRRGETIEMTNELRGHIEFIDAGVLDNKYILSRHPLTKRIKTTIMLSFWAFVAMKKILNKIRGRKGETAAMMITLL